MTAKRLVPRKVEKIWGRRDLPPPFGTVPDDSPAIGEIWFELPDEACPDLLVKYLFTSAELSVQVHPDIKDAIARGYRRGKDEAWLILSAEDGAAIGLGLKEAVAEERLRAAALDGSIEDLLDWKPAHAGDFYYSPAGTIHAIGAGLTLIEVQQNADLTYRLFDYGRDRELHIDEAVAVAKAHPYTPPSTGYKLSPARMILSSGSEFILERWEALGTGRVKPDEASGAWLIPIHTAGMIDGQPLEQGGVWLVNGGAEITLPPSSDLLVAYPGGSVREDMFKPA